MISLTEKNKENESLTGFPYYFYPGLSLAKILITWLESGPLMGSEPVSGGFYCSWMSVLIFSPQEVKRNGPRS